MSAVSVVHPQTGGWYFDGARTVELPDRKIDVALHGATFNLRLTLPESPFTGDLTEDSNVLSPLWAETEAMLRGLLDSLGFQLGAALEPQLLTGTIDGRSVIGTLTQFPGLARSPESRVSAEVIERYTQLIAANANVRHALLTCGQP